MTALFLPGLCSVTFRHLSADAIIKAASDAGLAAIEWGADVHVPPGRLDIAREIGRRTRDAGLTVSSYGSYQRPPADDLDAFRPVLDTAMALGAPVIRIWPGWRNRPSADYSHSDRSQAVEVIEAMGEAAAARNMAIGLEFHPGTLTDSTASAVRLMADITSPAVYLYWQPRPGLSKSEALAEIDAVGDDVAYTHVFQWDAQSRRYPLSDGLTAWRDIIAAIPNGRFSGWRYALLEFVADDSVAALIQDAAALKRLLTEMQATAST